VRVVRAIVGFWFRDDHGQDLADYCLLTALIALIGLGIFIHLSGGIQAIWNAGNSTLISGKSVAGGSTAGGADGSTGKVR
jgi:Flp pilus assembly pilin Flp